MSEQSPSHVVPEKSVKQRLVIKKEEEECYHSSMGAALETIKHESMINHLMPLVDIDIHTSQNYIFNMYV